MDFRTADTFYASLNRLTNQEQKAVKITVFDLQADPSSPGLGVHKLDRAKDPAFWSVRVNRDIRLIVHRAEESILVLYVDHHDDAYKWAERRKITTHPRTGAAQLVEIRETVEEERTAQPIDAVDVPEEPLLFAHLDPDTLLGYGVPEEWLHDIQRATESTLFDVAEHLPQEAAEALLELAVGGTPGAPAAAQDIDPFQHPDALRRFRVMENIEELERALDYPWERWSVFLHPRQRQYVERDYNGPARVAGTAGTGKTVVALHRTVRMAEAHPEARVLLTTFSPTLVTNLKEKLSRLASRPQVTERINVNTLLGIATRLHEENLGAVQMVSGKRLSGILEASMQAEDVSSTLAFVEAEWRDVVDAWGLDDWEAYRNVPRLGRKTRLGERQRRALWTVFERVRSQIIRDGMTTPSMLLQRVARELAGAARPFDFAVIDEAQDISVAELQFLSAFAGERPDALFFAGDLGQRIFQTPFSWKRLGVDVRGRSATLRINYRTSHQIRRHADKLLPAQVADVDGVAEDRTGVISIFEGVRPEVRISRSADTECEVVADWIRGVRRAGVAPEEIGVFVRSEAEFERAAAAIEAAGEAARIIDRDEAGPRAIAIGSMHRAKGLEFRAVGVMACDDEIIPAQARIEQVVDEADLQEVYETERHLLYVACTRARDFLLLSGVEPASEFFDDLELDVECLECPL